MLYLGILIKGGPHLWVRSSSGRWPGWTWIPVPRLPSSSPSPTINPRFSPCEILKHAHLKFTVYRHKQASIHTTHVHNAVTLVWGSLRLAPIITNLAFLPLFGNRPKKSNFVHRLISRWEAYNWMGTRLGGKGLGTRLTNFLEGYQHSDSDR